MSATSLAMALSRMWPAHFQPIFRCCGSRAVPTCLLKAPGVLPLLWTATLLVLRTVPRPSCSVVFAAAAVHDSGQVNHGLLGEGPEDAEGNPLVDAGKADADSGFSEGVASTTRGGDAGPQVGSFRGALHQLHDTSNEGKSDLEHSEEPGDEFGSGLDTDGKSDSEHSVGDRDGFGSEVNTGDIDSTDGGSYGGEGRRYSGDDIPAGSARRSGLGQEDLSVTERRETDESLGAMEPADEDGLEAPSPPAHEDADYTQPVPEGGVSAGEKEVKASDGDAEHWSRSDAGDGDAGGEEDRWNTHTSRHTQRGERRREESSKSAVLPRDEVLETEEPVTDRRRKSSRRTPPRCGHGIGKRRCMLARNANALMVLLAAAGIALLGGGWVAARQRRAAAARVPKN